MGATDPANGHTLSRLPEPASSGAAAPRSEPVRSGAAARAIAPFKKTTRLCLVVPRHLVERLEAHARSMSKSRDKFVEDILETVMRKNYEKRDKHLREAFGVDEADE